MERTDDFIQIEQLELSARIGVAETERAQSQRLTISLTFWPRRPLVDLGDDVRNTINYSEVCAEIKKIVAARTDKLIETLADHVATQLLRGFPIRKIRVELRKYVLRDVKYVSVTVTRETNEMS
ncbi:MAG: 7,8-dihydroneopterin aldolase/epimerase/oxygenase [Verrucomicrobiota bacterium]